MKSSKYLLLVSSAVLLSACGGGGGGSPSGAGDLQQPTNSGTTEKPELVFEFASDPMHPKVFNLAASTREEENHFYPRDTISLIWNVDIYYTDNTTIGLGERYLYDASVYLSADDVLQGGEDIMLFDIECSLPTTSQHACGESASFQCVYAKENQNTISCTSIPLDKQEGFTDLTVEISGFLDVIPKTANVIFQACLRDDPEICTEAVYPMELK